MGSSGISEEDPGGIVCGHISTLHNGHHLAERDPKIIASTYVSFLTASD
jgi:hypothetical protein